MVSQARSKWPIYPYLIYLREGVLVCELNLIYQSRESLPLNQFSNVSKFKETEHLEGRRGQVPTRKDPAILTKIYTVDLTFTFPDRKVIMFWERKMIPPIPTCNWNIYTQQLT